MLVKKVMKFVLGQRLFNNNIFEELELFRIQETKNKKLNKRRKKIQLNKIKKGSCLKTGQHSIFVIKRKIKKIMHICWIPYLLMILMTLWSNVFIIRIIIADARN